MRRIALVLALAAVAQAAPILTYTVTELPYGIEYDYTATNPFCPISSPGTDLYDIAFTFDTSLVLVLVPPGWDFVQSAALVEAFSLEPGEPPFGTDIAPGSTLQGFTFLFAEPVGPATFAASFIDPLKPDQPIILTGTATETAVPEPSTGLLLILGACLTGADMRRRRRTGLEPTTR